MSAETEKLKATLTVLHSQLSQIDELDSTTRDDLAEALAEIQTALNNKTSPTGKPLMRRLGEAARHFEDSHPALATSIGSLIDTLGRSGI
jgi:ABC-type transporter Mla subunit MlaD